MLRPIMNHIKCRNNIYPRSTTQRFAVPDDKTSWNSPYPEYEPPFYESPVIENKPWADPHVSKFPSFKWNALDGNINRKSHQQEYTFDSNMQPINIVGRTGLCGRGELGRWGPNHAADPIVTRWMRNEFHEKETNEVTGRYVLEMIAIKRRDNGEWAIPGGMVDPGETVSAALKREFTEEALNFDGNQTWDDFFKDGFHVYSGYVDDPRNTDNAWMETVVFNFHCPDDSLSKVTLKAGDDAVNVQWLQLNDKVELYASHKTFVKAVAEKLNAHW